MPYKRNYKKKRSRRPKRRTLTTRPQRYYSGIPDVFKTKLIYTEFVTGSTTTPSNIRINANNLYDPNQTGVGHQPYWRDQLATLYQRYRVLGCMIEVNGRMQTSGEVGRVYICPLTSGTSGFVNSGIMSEAKRVSKKVVTFQKPIYIKRYMSIASIDSVRPVTVKEDEVYSAPIALSTGPEATPGFQVSWANLDSGTSTAWKMEIRVTYFTEFYQKQWPAQS